MTANICPLPLYCNLLRTSQEPPGDNNRRMRAVQIRGAPEPRNAKQIERRFRYNVTPKKSNNQLHIHSADLRQCPVCCNSTISDDLAI